MAKVTWGNEKFIEKVAEKETELLVRLLTIALGTPEGHQVASDHIAERGWDSRQWQYMLSSAGHQPDPPANEPNEKVSWG